MKSRLKNLLASLYNRIILFNNPYYFYGIPKDDYITEGEHVFLKKFGLPVHPEKHASLIKGYAHAASIQTALNGKFTVQKDFVYLEILDLKFQINSAEELFIIYEVFVTNDYKYGCLRDSVFIDIGMNAGVTTLYYARNPLVKKIYAFELFRPTYLLGLQNLKLNEKFTHKVTAVNVGLSSKTFKTALEYSPSRKGRMGLKGLPSDETFQDTVKEEVEVRDIHDAFSEIIAASANMDIIVKMDCEGEEYTLVNRLAETGLLSRLNALIIEWHYRDPEEMEQQLRNYDFQCFSQTLPSLDSGMIYAARGKR